MRTDVCAAPMLADIISVQGGMEPFGEHVA